MQPVSDGDTHRSDRYARVRELMRLALVRAVDHREVAKHAADGTATEPLCDACRLARAEDVHAEQLIIILKQSWRELADDRLLKRPDADDALSDIVTRCIREYYRME